MRNLTRNFLSEEDKKRIIGSVKEVEKITSGEIVPMVVSSSYHYPLADVLGALTIGSVIAILVTIYVSYTKAWEGFSAYDLWVFPGVFSVSFLVFYFVVRFVLPLKRVFISREEMRQEVEEAALTSFYRRGLGNTRDKTGVLIYISVFERLAYVLADEGINAKVDPKVWKDVVDVVIKGIKEKRQADGIVEAIKLCGELLKENFPIKPDDTDELENLIVD